LLFSRRWASSLVPLLSIAACSHVQESAVLVRLGAADTAATWRATISLTCASRERFSRRFLSDKCIQAAGTAAGLTRGCLPDLGECIPDLLESLSLSSAGVSPTWAARAAGSRKAWHAPRLWNRESRDSLRSVHVCKRSTRFWRLSSLCAGTLCKARSVRPHELSSLHVCKSVRLRASGRFSL
jgi:hypothetical protein